MVVPIGMARKTAFKIGVAMFISARPSGKTTIFEFIKNPKYFKKIKNRKMRRNLYRYIAQNKKMRIKFRGKNIWKNWDAYKEKLDREEFKRQYFCQFLD
ncbi:hypothetical protein QSV37_17580 [Acinetobacter sp. VNK23]|uniref:hypothetical protein n=1 Tax=Acinetobacter thutiue TaxID=2998078 RepID=UPI002577DA6E|nr:hypothetical protein [Acinetobacter thutiue]MDM1022086.1 hypothetical protein [Acinetobacter thutiue]